MTVISYFAGQGQYHAGYFTHWPNHQVLYNLSDENLQTCVKFTPVQLGKNVLLKAPDLSVLSLPNWHMLIFSKNLALPSECKPSILVMTQVGVSSTADESLCRPFCGNLLRGNMSMQSKPGLEFHSSVQWQLNYMSVPGDLMMVHFPCDFRHQCKGIFIHITTKALVDPTLDLEMCEVGAGYVYQEPYKNRLTFIDNFP